MGTKQEGNGLQPQHELENLMPEDEKSKEIIVSKYNMAKDVESAGDFDPFAERKVDNPTSNNDTLTHLLKASLGTGILAMPFAFKAAGLVLGIFFTILVAVVCTHCSYVLIKCAHVLYKKTRKTTMSFPEVGQAALENGPESLRRWGNAFRLFILVSLFMTYFGTCSVYTVIVAKNILQVVAHYMNVAEKDVEIRIFIIALLLPLIFMAWVRNLKYLAPVSMIANVFMGVGLGITFYYLVGTGSLDFSKVQLVTLPSNWPQFFSLTIFAMEAIGVVMPLENAMKTPRSMLGFCGVLNKGMSGVTLIYMLLGFLGYLRYVDQVEDSITLNLDINEIPAQIVKISIAIAVYCTFGLQFFVCVDIMWSCIKDKFTKRPDLADYVMRTIMVTLCVMLAVAVPTIGPFMGVIGAFCFSILGLIAPAFIEVITYWDIGFGPCKFLIWKNILVLIFGLFALVFGTKDAIFDIIKAYS
ncbi:proton-coupled amino acid transporter-like protein pathetic [Leguminivora glycinivorella]|uniref:proton-coupled amino acid transporter-like protein pathetic n=1 Tax=Leguminivora glycinivorella TaxID=1035111 RepID=UPI002010C35D|nr:proton-coupled amino acid transporter-like protein pathetic [Leguminivora glycinivorella]XP_048005281.1 proton-coupled amino acid transporter-like protein pathetic [Leguminivora glycinivorella]